MKSSFLFLKKYFFFFAQAYFHIHTVRQYTFYLQIRNGKRYSEHSLLSIALLLQNCKDLIVFCLIITAKAMRQKATRTKNDFYRYKNYQETVCNL